MVLLCEIYVKVHENSYVISELFFGGSKMAGLDYVISG